MSLERLEAIAPPPPGPQPVDWLRSEALLGTPLPAAFRALMDRYGAGTFDLWLDTLVPDDGAAEDSMLARTRVLGDRAPGVLVWGSAEPDLDLGWETAGAPETWTLVAVDHDGTIERFDLDAAAFVARALTGELDSVLVRAEEQAARHGFTPRSRIG